MIAPDSFPPQKNAARHRHLRRFDEFIVKEPGISPDIDAAHARYCRRRYYAGQSRFTGTARSMPTQSIITPGRR